MQGEGKSAATELYQRSFHQSVNAVLVQLVQAGVHAPYYAASELGKPLDVMWQSPSLVIRFTPRAFYYGVGVYAAKMRVRMVQFEDWSFVYRKLLQLFYIFANALNHGYSTEQVFDSQADPPMWMFFPMSKNMVCIS